MNLQDLERMIAQSGGLYPLDIYRRGTIPSGGVTTLKDVNLPGVNAPQTGGVSMVNNIPTANLPTANIPTSGATRTAPTGNRLDEITSDISIDDVLGGISRDDINLGNIDDIANILTAQIDPRGTQDSGFLKGLIKEVIAAGQSPQFQQGFREAKTSIKETQNEVRKAVNKRKDLVYGELLKVALAEDKNSKAGEKVVNIFDPNDIDLPTKGFGTGKIVTDRDGNEKLLKKIMNEDGTSSFAPAGAAVLQVRNTGDAEAFLTIGGGGAKYQDYLKQVGNSANRVAGAFNIIGPVNQMLEIATQAGSAPADIAGFTGAIRGFLGQFSTEVKNLERLIMANLPKEEEEKLKNTQKLFENLNTTDNNATSANRLENAVDDQGNPIGFKWSQLGAEVANDAIYKALFLELAYYSLLLKGQESRAVSDKDIINALGTIGANTGTREGAARAIINFTAGALDKAENEISGLAKPYLTKITESFRKSNNLSEEDIKKDFTGPISTLLDPNNINYEEFQRYLNLASIYGRSIGSVRGPYEVYLQKYLNQPIQSQEKNNIENIGPPQKSASDIAIDAAKSLGIDIGVQ